MLIHLRAWCFTVDMFAHGSTVGARMGRIKAYNAGNIIQQEMCVCSVSCETHSARADRFTVIS